jgi:hypothetical protein
MSVTIALAIGVVVLVVVAGLIVQGEAVMGGGGTFWNRKHWIADGHHGPNQVRHFNGRGHDHER